MPVIPENCKFSAATKHALRRREQRSLCIATAEQRQPPSIHRNGQSSAVCASLRRSIGRNRALATARAGQTTAQHRQRPSATRARAGQTMRRFGGATAATYPASLRREQGRLCKDTTEQRQGQQMHRAGESRPGNASQQRRNGSDSSCTVTATTRGDGESSIG